MWCGPWTKRSRSTASSPKAFFAPRRCKLLVELGVLRDEPHSLAPAAGHGLDEQRKPDLLRLLTQELRVLVLAVITGHDGHAGVLHDRLGAVLQPHFLDRFRRGTDEDEARGLDAAREILVLREESIDRKSTRLN